MIPQEALEEQLGNILNRLNLVISEGKGLLNERNIPYDNLPAFDSIIKAITDYPNYKPYRQRLQNTWFEPAFFKENKEYYVNVDPVIMIIPYGNNYLAITTKSMVFFSEDCSTFKFLFSFSLSNPVAIISNAYAFPPHFIDQCPYGILIVGYSDTIEIDLFDMNGVVDYLCIAGATAYGVAVVNSKIEIPSDVDSVLYPGFTISILADGYYDMVSVLYHPTQKTLGNNEVFLDKSYPGAVTNKPMAIKASSYRESDIYDSHTEELFATTSHVVHVSHVGGTAASPATFYDVCESGLYTFVGDKIVTIHGNILKIHCKSDTDGMYSIHHTINLTFQNTGESIVDICCISSEILAIITTHCIYLYDNFDSALSYMTLDNGIKLPSTLEGIHRISHTRKYIHITDNTAKCFVIRFPDTMANENALSVGTESLEALTGRYIKGNIDSMLRGYSWLDSPIMSADTDGIIKRTGPDVVVCNDTVYGNGIGIIYNFGSFDGALDEKNAIYTIDGEHWMTLSPGMLPTNVSADFITFMRGKFYALRALRSTGNFKDNMLVVFSSSGDLSYWDTHTIAYDNLGKDEFGNDSMKSRLAVIQNGIGTDDGIFLCSRTISKCAALSPGLTLDYIPIGEEESAHTCLAGDIPYGAYIKGKLYIGGMVKDTSEIDKAIMIVGTMAWRPRGYNADQDLVNKGSFSWNRLLKVYVKYGSTTETRDGIHLYTNGETLLAATVSFVTDFTADHINTFTILNLYNTGIRFGELERLGYGESVTVSLSDENRLDMNWIKKGQTETFYDITICGTYYVLWGRNMIVISSDGVNWNIVSQAQIPLSEFTNGYLCGSMIGEMCVLQVTDLTNKKWMMRSSGTMTPWDTHTFVLSGLFKKNNYFEYQLDFTPRVAALFAFGAFSTSAHLVSTHKLIRHLDEDIYSIIINGDVQYKNSEDISHMASIEDHAVLFTGGSIAVGNEFIFIAF